MCTSLIFIKKLFLWLLSINTVLTLKVDLHPTKCTTPEHPHGPHPQVKCNTRSHFNFVLLNFTQTLLKKRKRNFFTKIKNFIIKVFSVKLNSKAFFSMNYFLNLRSDGIYKGLLLFNGDFMLATPFYLMKRINNK